MEWILWGPEVVVCALDLFFCGVEIGMLETCGYENGKIYNGGGG